MSKQIRFYVIGGQYERVCYGGTPTLLGAKRLASKYEEYWDNWQGWHKPDIYLADDTHLEESYGRITSRDGEIVRLPNVDAVPLEV